MKSKKTAKEKIFDTAVDLFARKGFNAVGIREISRSAGVNISMISYYYGSKNSLLISIIDHYFDTYHIPLLKKSMISDKPLCEKVTMLIHGLVDIMKEKPALAKVAIYELPFEISEIMECKLKKLSKIRSVIMENLFAGMDVDEKNKLKYMMIVGPALISMTTSYFMLSSVINAVNEKNYCEKHPAHENMRFDDSFFNMYKESISELFVNGFDKMWGNLKKKAEEGCGE